MKKYIKNLLLLFFIFNYRVSSAEDNLNFCTNDKKIKKISFDTRLNLSKITLSRNLGILEDDPCDILKINEAVEILYKREIFKTVKYSIKNLDDQIEIIFHLEAFNIISEISVRNNNYIDTRDIKRELRKRTGDSIKLEDLGTLEKYIKDFYSSSGYPQADIKIKLIAENTYPLVSLLIDIDERAPLRYENVVIDTNNNEIHRSKIEDIKSYSSSVVRDRLSIRKIKHYTFLKFKEDRYFQAKIKIKEDLNNLFIKIDSGDKIYFSSVGNKFFTEEQIFDSLQLGTRFLPLTNNSNKLVCNDLKSEYLKNGFLNSNINCSWVYDSSKNEKKLLVEIEEGIKDPKKLDVQNNEIKTEETTLESITDKLKSTEPDLPIVSNISISGNYFTQDRVILRELGFSVGESLSEEMLEKSRRSILSLGIFSFVEIQIETLQESNQVNVKVLVKEKETGLIQGLAEISSQDGLHVQSQIAQRNLSGTGKALILGVDGYIRENLTNLDAARARLAFGSPKLLGSSLDYNLEGFYQTALNLNQTFKLDRVGITQGLRYPFLEGFRLNLSNSVYSERLFEVNPNIVISERDNGTTNYSVVRTSIELDKRDDPFISTKGYRVELGGSYFPSQLGSQVDMVEAHIQETTIFPILENLSYAFNFRSGMFETLNSDNVPLGSRYFLGGRDSLRGYTRFQVGPRASSGTVVGGDTFLVFSQELRRDIGNGILGILFLDFGQSFLRNSVNSTIDSKNKFKDFKISPGVGLQYATPIGPISAEAGFATNREFGERWGRFILSIGNAF